VPRTLFFAFPTAWRILPTETKDGEAVERSESVAVALLTAGSRLKRTVSR
jgi:hypothetical protein